jgi:hypothetical protein
MKPLARTPPGSPPSRTRVLLVRPAGPIRSVRRADEPQRPGLRLAIWVISTVGTVFAVWLIGYLGFRLGFAPLIDVPQLEIDLGGGLVTGALMLVSMPVLIIRAGMAQPLWLMIAFLAIAIPAGGLGAARAHTPGGPRPSTAAIVFAHAGAVAAGLDALALLWWTASPIRAGAMEQFRIDPRSAVAWLDELATVAGLDVLAVVVAALWVVLVLRLVIPLWLRALAGTASIFVLVVVTVAMAMSNGALSELSRARSQVFLEDGPVGARLVLGATPGHLAILRLNQGVAVIELEAAPGRLTVVGRQSIAGLLEAEVRRAARRP